MSLYNEILATEKYVENITDEKVEDVRITTSVQGESVIVSDSADAELKGLKVMGKTEQFTTTGAQLIQYPFSYSSGYEGNGITYTYTTDGVLTVKGTSSESGSWFNFNDGITLPAGDYTLSYSADSSADKSGAKFYVQDVDMEVTLVELNFGTTTNSKTFTLSEDKPNVRIYMAVIGGVTLEGQIKVQLQSGTSATVWEPYTGGEPAPNVNYPQPLESVGDDGSVHVGVHGYQLFDASKIPSAKIRGVTLTNNGDGSFSFSGTPTKAGQSVYTLSHAETVALLKAGHIMLTDYFGNTSTNPYVYMKLSYNNEANSVEINMSKADMATIEITQDMLDDESCYAVFGIYISTKMDITNTTIKPMLYQDGDGTWEPYKPMQTLTIATPNGLPGVPVPLDGNYTDASGQQWVCDEKDCGGEFYLQRVYEFVVTGNEEWSIAGSESNSYYNYKIMTSLPYSSKLTTNTSTHTYQKEACCSHLCSNTTVYTDTATDYGFIVVKQMLYIRTSLVQSNDITPWTDFCKQQYEAGTPVTFKYILATPIETPLSDDEKAAYKALRTDKLNTSIHNSENAYMVVDYVADTKNYIDNKVNKAVVELSSDKTDILNDTTTTDVVIESLESNAEKVYGELTSISVAFSTDVGLDYMSSIVFSTPAELQENYSTFPSEVYFKGDECDEGIFIPNFSTRYTILFYYDGVKIIGLVSGIEIEVVASE